MHIIKSVSFCALFVGALAAPTSQEDSSSPSDNDAGHTSQKSPGLQLLGACHSDEPVKPTQKHFEMAEAQAKERAKLWAQRVESALGNSSSVTSFAAPPTDPQPDAQATSRLDDCVVPTREHVLGGKAGEVKTARKLKPNCAIPFFVEEWSGVHLVANHVKYLEAAVPCPTVNATFCPQSLKQQHTVTTSWSIEKSAELKYSFKDADIAASFKFTEGEAKATLTERSVGIEVPKDVITYLGFVP